MRKACIFLAVCMILTGAMFPACAGEFWAIIVATEGDGAKVYSQPRGSVVGVLYNGYEYESSGSMDEKDPFWPIKLTNEYTVYLNPVSASSAYPDKEEKTPGWEDRLPFEAFLGQVKEDNAVLRSKPDKRSHLIAKHAAGSQFMVWGEFGSYYYVQTRSCYGFMSKSAIFEALSPTKSKAYASYNSWNWPYLEDRTLYPDHGVIFTSDSAARFSENVGSYVRKGDDKVQIRTYLSDSWAQLQDGSFIETRYLEPDGDHTPYQTARIKTSSIANRLNVRMNPDSNSFVKVKLCSGVEVEVISQTDEWAVIGLCGANTEIEFGCVQRKYLEFSKNKKVTDGTVRARVTNDLIVDPFYAIEAQTKIEKNSIVTVLGVGDGFYIDRKDSFDTFLIRDEEGRLYWIYDETGSFEPLEYPPVKAKTTTAISMRKEPKLDADVLLQIPSGTKVDVLLRGEGFTMICYKDQIGYVLSRQLSF